MAFQVHCHDGVPVGFCHRGEHAVTVDAGVVQHNVQVTECLDRFFHCAFAVFVVGDVRGVGDGLAAFGLDFIDHFLCGFFVDVVNHNGTAFFGEDFGVCCAQAATGAGDDGYSIVQNAHSVCPLCLFVFKVGGAHPTLIVSVVGGAHPTIRLL